MALSYGTPVDEPPDARAVLAALERPALRCVGRRLDTVGGPWPEAPLYLYDAGVSVRTVEACCAEGVFVATVRVLACAEEHALAWALVAAVAARGAGEMVCDEDEEPFLPSEVAAREGPKLQGRMARDLAAVLARVATDGTTEVSGPFRPFHLGPRVASELLAVDAAERLAELHARMRRVQYLPEDVYAANVSVNAAGRTAMTWGPGLTYLFRRVDALHLVGETGLPGALGPTVPFDALEALSPSPVTWVDEVQVLVPAVPRAQWPGFVAKAAEIASPPRARPWWRFW